MGNEIMELGGCIGLGFKIILKDLFVKKSSMVFNQDF